MNVANKFLLEGFFSVERTWRNICAVRNVNDFKTVTSYRLIGTDQYEQIAPGGQFKHGTLGNETYTNKADTYGLLLGVDRRDIINDDLGAITTVPRKLGRGSGLKINDVFWTIFLNNGAFFSFPPVLAQALHEATPEQLAEVEVVGAGSGLYFPAIDADLYVPALIEGVFGSKTWMAGRMGQDGGRSRSERKAAAARANGKLGGRPRKAG